MKVPRSHDSENDLINQDYVFYQAENENFNESFDENSIVKNNKLILINLTLIIFALVVAFIVSVLNVDFLKPLGLFGEFLRYIVGGLLIGYLILFFRLVNN